MNRLLFFANKLPLQELCRGLAVVQAFTLFAFSSWTLTPKRPFLITRVFGEALLSKPVWIKSLVSHSTTHLKIVLYRELFCLSIKKEVLKFWETDYLLQHSRASYEWSSMNKAVCILIESAILLDRRLDFSADLFPRLTGVLMVPTRVNSC